MPHFESPPPDPLAPPAPAPLNFTRPTPRPPRSASESARVRILNRRREYLSQHPSYMASAADNELADPVLYDSLVRRFQTPAEREAEGRRRGYGHVLESSLLRSEAHADANANAAAGVARLRIAASYVGEEAALDPDPTTTTTTTNDNNNNNSQEETIFSVDAALDAPPADRAEARARWLAFLRDRFVAGRDDDFDYAAVDGDDDYDVLERRDAEDAWFDREEPSWDDEDGDDDGDDDDDDDDEAEDAEAATRKRRGETGIQDY